MAKPCVAQALVRAQVSACPSCKQCRLHLLKGLGCGLGLAHLLPCSLGLAFSVHLISTK